MHWGRSPGKLTLQIIFAHFWPENKALVINISLQKRFYDMTFVANRWFVLFKADTNGGHPSTLGDSHPDEQRHTHAGARRGIWLWVSRWKRLHQFLLLFRRLPLWSLAAWKAAHSHCQDRLIRTHLLSHCVCSLQSGLLGLLSISLGMGAFPASPLPFSVCSAPASDILQERDPLKYPEISHFCYLSPFKFVLVFSDNPNKHCTYCSTAFYWC